MSMNGESLADWQAITERVNERLQAMGYYIGGLVHIPVPTSKDHLTNVFVSQMGNTIKAFFGSDGYLNGFWVDPDQPFAIVGPSSPHWNGSYQTGNYICNQRKWVPTLQEVDKRAIFATLPEVGAIPLRGSELAKLGTFLEQCQDALELLTKASLRDVAGYGEEKEAFFNWDPNTGEIFNTNTYAQVGSAATFADFYTFALANLTTYTHVNSAHCKTEIYNNGTRVYLHIQFSSVPVFYYGINGAFTTPGGIHADLTVYYSSFGDNCGYPVNSSTTHLDYSTLTFQNVGPEPPITIGFDASSVSTVPTMPTAGNSYTKQENLYNIHALWDFAPYFQY